MIPAWLLLGLALPLGAPEAAELVTIEHRTVVAWPSLVLREAPSTSSTVLVTVPFGEQVAVASRDEALPTTLLAGQRGRWRPVRWGTWQGWMFDAWLLPLPPPPDPCASLDAWLVGWDPVGNALTEWHEDARGQRWAQQIQHYEDGARLVRSQQAGPLPNALWLPDIAPAQAWLIARRCHPDLSALASDAWPPRSRAGATVTRDEHQLTIADDEGPALRLRGEDDGVWLSWR